MTVSAIGVDVSGTGPVFVAETQSIIANIYSGDELIDIRKLSEHDLQASLEGRFVEPSGSWASAADILMSGLLVIIGDVGIGKRTAAINLLLGLCNRESIMEVESSWGDSTGDAIPYAQAAHGYLCDLTSADHSRLKDDFGTKIQKWARGNSCFVVMTAMKNARTSRWAAAVKSITVELSSPKPRALLESELRAKSREVELEYALGRPEIRLILDSNVRAADVCRLAEIICSSDDFTSIIGEYSDWRSEIDRQMDAAEKDIETRALIWSSAFCDTGTPAAVLQMSEELCRCVHGDHARNVVLSVLGAPPASTRFARAKIETTGGRTVLESGRRGYPAAVRRYLWSEYPSQRKFLTDWVMWAVQNLPSSDADKVADSVYEVAIHKRDNQLLSRLRDTLIKYRRDSAVRIFTSGALDPNTGGYVRERLYSWLNSQSVETSTFIVDVCGGDFGQKMPGRALTRIGRAARAGRVDRDTMARALVGVAEADISTVLRVIDVWFVTDGMRSVGIRGFLALASSRRGALIIQDGCAASSGGVELGERVVIYLATALEDAAYQADALAAVELWRKLSREGDLSVEFATRTVGAAVKAVLNGSVLEVVLHHIQDGDDPFWGKVMKRAMHEPETIGVHIGEPEIVQ